jgi:hypothetical protein
MFVFLHFSFSKRVFLSLFYREDIGTRKIDWNEKFGLRNHRELPHRGIGIENREYRLVLSPRF